MRGSARVRALQLLLAMLALAGGLFVWNAWTTGRDRATALGEATPGQRKFFVALATRPDAANFYKGLEPTERRKMAENMARHTDAPEMARLAVVLLGTLDEDARASLAATLAAIGPVQTQAVAAELKESGGFQRNAVFAALRAAGEGAVTEAAEQLAVPAARANAIAFLVERGRTAIPVAMPYLDHEDRDTRGAAADVLGKIRAPEAVEKLTTMYEEAPADERVAYLTALSSIADLRSEALLVKTLRDRSSPSELRSLAAIGLGRVGSPSAIRLLWGLQGESDLDLRLAVVSGLQTAGDEALSPGILSPFVLQVASGCRGPNSDRLIASALNSSLPSLALAAARAAVGREPSVEALRAAWSRFDPDLHGDVVDAICAALASTDSGLAELRALASSDHRAAAFAVRRLALAGES